ncbi:MULTISPECIES: hypothetical protein [unclassified Spirosoma]|nr:MULTISPECIES: hypothetical protein [unclassified Spirosoma]MBN8821521.1 hypothetical protein [Spirosoma sp.]
MPNVFMKLAGTSAIAHAVSMVVLLLTTLNTGREGFSWRPSSVDSRI